MGTGRRSSSGGTARSCARRGRSPASRRATASSGTLFDGRWSERPAVHLLHDDAVQRAVALPRARGAERRGVQRCADGRADRRAHVRRRERVPHRCRARARAAVGRRSRARCRVPHERGRGPRCRRSSSETSQRGRRCPGGCCTCSRPDSGSTSRWRPGWPTSRSREPLVPGSRFRIASVTKPFVAAATLRLVEDGALSLDDTVATLLPGEVRRAPAVRRLRRPSRSRWRIC